MAELVATTGNPCSLINGTVVIDASGTERPATTLLLGTTSPATFDEVVAQAFTGGVLNTFTTHASRLKAKFTGAGDPSVLSASAGTATKVLHKFLNGDSGTSADFLRSLSTNAIDYTKLKNILLYVDSTGTAVGSSTTAYKSIIHDYIAPKSTGGAAGYTFNTVNVSASPVTTNFKVADSSLWTSADEPSTGIVATPASVLGSLLKDGLLIKKDELFKETDFSATRTANQESLYWLVSTSSQPTETLTQDQLIRKNRLLAKNLRFFGAFLVEYCYYKAIYYRLLKQYYVAYSTFPATGSLSSSQWTTNIDRLFTTTQTDKTRVKYMEGLTDQMARLMTRMNDMRRLLSTITAYYNTQFNTISSTIAGSSATFGSTENLVQSINALNDTTEKTRQYNDQKDFRKQIIEYTEQKNRYANMLLGLYAFLNISALAAIFHISSSS